MKKYYVSSVFALVISLIASVAPAQATFTIFGPFPIITTTYGVGSVPLVPPTTNSPAPWIFSSSNPKVATISGKTIKVVGAGTSTITASQAAFGVFTARSRSTQIRVALGTPVLGEFAPQSISITQKTYTLVPPTSTSDGIWNFMSTNSNIASVSGNKLTFHSGGSVFIYATQSSTPNWESASTSMKFTVVTIAPVLGTFGDISIMKDSVGSLTLNPPASTSSGWWTFTSSDPSVASVVSNIVTPLAFGTTVITATQNAVGDYSSATTSMTLTVDGPSPTLGAFPDVTAQMSTSTSLNLQPPNSNSPGAWSFTSSDPSVASIVGATATLLKPGIATITANQMATSTFAAPKPVSMTLTVVGKPTVGAWADIQKVVKDPDFELVAPISTSSGAWTYTSSDPSIIALVGKMAKVVGAGKVSVTGTQAATSIFSQGSAQMSIQVFGAIPTVGSLVPIQGAVGDAPIALKAPSSNSSGTWTYSSSDRNVAAVDGFSLVFVGAGTATIYATQNPAGIYSQSNTLQTTVSVSAKASPTPTPSVKPTPTPTPTPSVKPTPTPTPTPTPSVRPTPTPTAAINTTIKVTASGRVITVVAIGVKALVFINGKPAKVGKNTVKAGSASVVITIADRVVYRRVFSIK